jgi:YidC/Oxa1 family membrane protein insertase
VIDATMGPVTLTFEFQDTSGLRARKEFVIQPDSYVVQFQASVTRGEESFNPMVVWGPGLGDAATSTESSRYLQKPEAIFFDQGSVRRVAAGQLTPDRCTGARSDSACAWEGDFRFAGVDDHYFVSAVLPKGRMRIEYQPAAVPAPGQSGQTNELVSYAAKGARAAPGLRVFAGPKEFDVLAAADPQMVRVINFGMFSWLAVPLLRALKSINGYVGNYGWAIIILTVLINAAMFPLRHKSMVSMRKLQALQPEIKAIQDRYAKIKATDPARQKMNVEMMNLYREKGVNPASGCLPMLITMPVLFAFYAMLSQAIEVRGAPFALWIKDLSRHDPYYVLPILMGLTMVWQQKMTPSSVDPAQQKMMMFMPVMFTAFFLWAPSGLALYFLLSNLLAIGQQYLTNSLVPAPGRPARTPEARRAKGKAQGN